MQTGNNSAADASTVISIAVATELTTRIFEKIAGGIISNEVNGVVLNPQSVSGLVSARLSQELLGKVEEIQ